DEFLVAQACQAFEQLALLVVELRGGLDLQVDHEVAAHAAAQARDAELGQLHGVHRLGSGLDADLLLAIEGVQLHLRAQGRGRHRNAQRRVQVVALAFEHRMTLDVDLHVEVPGGSAAGTGLALAGEVDAGACGDAGGDLQLLAHAFADASLTHALVAGAGQDGSETAAGAAGLDRHHLAQEGPDRTLHLPLAVADRAGLRGGPGLAAAAVADRAGDGRLDVEGVDGALDGVLELDGRSHQGVAAALRARRRSLGLAATEELLEDIAEAAEPPGSANAAGGAVFVAGRVIDLALLRVGEHLVGVGD